MIYFVLQQYGVFIGLKKIIKIKIKIKWKWKWKWKFYFKKII